MDDAAVEIVQTVLAETRWLPTPCPTEYLPALARDVLYALKKAGMPVVVLPKPCRIPTWWNEECLGGWESTRGDPVSAWPSAERGVALPEAQFISISDARTLAGALLAAASAAESSVVATPQEHP